MSGLARSQGDLKALGNASRNAAILTAVGMTVAVGSLVFASIQLNQLDQKVAEKQSAITAKERKLEELEKRRESLLQEMAAQEAFIDGRTPVAAVGEKRDVTSQLTPHVSYRRLGWRFEFAFELSAPAEVAKEIERVSYEIPIGTSETAKLDGTGTDFRATTRVSDCSGSAEARVTFKSGDEGRIKFDWCGLADWKNSWKYDPQDLIQLETLSANCSRPLAVLDAVHPTSPVLERGWRIGREVYRAHRFLHPEDGKEKAPVEFYQQKAKNRPFVALVAECQDAETCIGLAAAYHAVKKGRAPELYCSQVPSLEDEKQPAAGLETLRLDQAPPLDDHQSQCFRLAACEGASRGKVERFDAVECARKPNKYPLSCASKADCSEVLSCTESGSADMDL